MSTRIGVLPVALVVAVLSVSAQSAPQKPQDPQRPIFRSEANFVRVDVFPTRNGAPVKDLVAEDFEVLEDGVKQKLETFEFIQVRSGLSQPERRDPNTVQESRDIMRDPRARVFVLFLDIPHVTTHGTWNVRAPLLRLIDRVLGPDDLVGVMTPQMSASDIAFARKTEVVADGLMSRWPWGERFTIVQDDREKLYEACYPWPELKSVVAEMTARRRERSTLDALNEVVLWLRDQREERKAILTVSEGWLLFGENRDLTRPRVIDPRTGEMEPIPGPEPIGTGPDGRLRVGHDNNYRSSGTKTTCDTDRVLLSNLNNERYLRDIAGAANTANASFYTVDPRGLAVFDVPIGPAPPPPVDVSISMLQSRIESLRTIADATDGMAVVGSNDIEKGLRRMADDLTSYYLLGYYSTNSRLDGGFRQIKVRTRQPGVDIRARRGYRAATEREVTEARAAAAAPVPEHVAAARTALSGLARLRPAAEFSAHAVAMSGEKTTVWVSGELKAAATTPATADINVTSGSISSSVTATIPAGARAFLVPLVLAGKPDEPIAVRVRVGVGSGLPLTDMLKIDAVAGLGHPMLYRRGPSTGNRLQPAGSPAYMRTERVRLEIPAAVDTGLSASRVLDRNGVAIELPVTVADRTDHGGQRWLTAEVILAPLAPGDYIIEMSGTVKGAVQTVLSPIRVIR